MVWAEYKEWLSRTIPFDKNHRRLIILRKAGSMRFLMNQEGMCKRSFQKHHDKLEAKLQKMTRKMKVIDNMYMRTYPLSILQWDC